MDWLRSAAAAAQTKAAEAAKQAQVTDLSIQVQEVQHRAGSADSTERPLGGAWPALAISLPVFVSSSAGAGGTPVDRMHVYCRHQRCRSSCDEQPYTSHARPLPASLSLCGRAGMEQGRLACRMGIAKGCWLAPRHPFARRALSLQSVRARTHVLEVGEAGVACRRR